MTAVTYILNNKINNDLRIIFSDILIQETNPTFGKIPQENEVSFINDMGMLTKYRNDSNLISKNVINMIILY